MTDYTELVKALRGLANGIWKNCEYTWFGGEEKVFADAAAAIEALQAEVKDAINEGYNAGYAAGIGTVHSKGRRWRCRMVIETLGEIRAKYNFWNEKERPCYEALSEAIRVLNAQEDKVHYAKIVRCRECKYHLSETERTNPYCNRFHCMKPDDWFCADGEREVQE